MRRIFCLFVLTVFLAAACSDDDSGGTTGSTGNVPVVDLADPIPGNSGSLSLSDILTNRITVTWTAATDDVCANLEYKVVFSTNSNIFTLSDAEANGQTGMDWTVGVTNARISGLTVCWPYYFNVLVRDVSNHRAVYSISHSWTKAPCPPAATGQTSLWAVGDDGDLETGEVWPSPRFTNNGDGTVTDNLTGLIWQQTNSSITMNWTNAIEYANTNTLAGQTDWRLPNIIELNSIYNAGYMNNSTWMSSWFTGVQSGFYISSTTYTALNTQAYGLYMVSGDTSQVAKTGGNYVLIVRGESNLPKTGQTTSFTTGDDGDLQKGVSWPSPRFLNRGDGSVVDRLTGLMWEQSPVTTTEAWAAGLTTIAGKSTAGHTDWRMPNRNELYSLVTFDYGVRTFEWLNAGTFMNVQGAYYHSGTTAAYDNTRTCCVYFYNSSQIEARAKTETVCSWAVR